MQGMGVFFLNYEPKLQNVADQSQEMYFFDCIVLNLNFEWLLGALV